MRYYLCAEGGGSKLIAILYDEQFRIVHQARAGGVNYRDTQEVRTEIRQLLDKVVPSEITVLEAVDASLVAHGKTFEEVVRDRFPDVPIYRHGEGEVVFAAAGVSEGIVAQSGTGSDAFLMQKEGWVVAGAWGVFLGDEGSGFDIGRRGLRAAIRYQDGWGEPTVLHELLCEEFGAENGLRSVFGKVTQTFNDRSRVAAFSRTVGKAVAMGDAVATDIVRHAAHLMAQQVLAVIRRNGGTFRGPIIASGGAWRTSPIMFDAFREEVLASYPDAEVRYPIFEPIVGCILCRLGPSDELIETFRKNFADYLY